MTILCLYYQYSDSESPSTDSVPPEPSVNSEAAMCDHKASANLVSEPVSCEGQFPHCNVRLNDDELSVFINTEILYKRVDFVLNVGDDYGILKTESFSWLTFELIRRFGRRQSGGVESLFTIKGAKFEFSSDSAPTKFGEYTIFPLEFV